MKVHEHLCMALNFIVWSWSSLDRGQKQSEEEANKRLDDLCYRLCY